MTPKRFLHHIVVIFALVLALFPTHGVTAQTSSGTSPQCATLPATINVWIVIFLSEWPVGTSQYQMGVPFENYVYGVVMGELGPQIPNGPYTGNVWSDEVLKAQSVAARTWGSYWCHKHFFNGGQGVKNGATDQVYRPYHAGFNTSTKQRYVDVSNGMQNIYLSYEGLLLQSPYKGVIPDAQFRRDVGNPSSSWTSLGYDYLRSVNNPRSIGYNDGPGWAQTPSHGWTQANDHSASWYQVLMHYYTGLQTAGATPSFTAQYYNNTSCTGSPVTSNSVDSINFDWGTGSPTPGVNVDNFCIQYTNSNVNFPYSDWYTFFITADDGFRLYWDGTLILDKWVTQAPTQYSVSLPATAGTHSITFNYFEAGGGAVARLDWIRGRGMIGTYYDSVIAKTGNPTYAPVVQRPDSLIQFDWDSYSPLDTREGTSRIYEDTFSALWKDNVYIPSCRWVTFSTRSDDGVFVKITHPSTGSDQTLIDHWDDHGPANDSSPIWLCPGTYPIEARYYENGGGAVINIGWN